MSSIDTHLKMCTPCKNDFSELSKLGLKTAWMIASFERLKSQWDSFARSDNSTKAGMQLIEAHDDVDRHLQMLDPKECGKASRLAHCLFSPRAKL